MGSLETQHHKDTSDLGDPVMSTNLVFSTKATSAVPASAWTPPLMRGSLLHWATVTIRVFVLILSQALPFVTSTLWNHPPYDILFPYDTPSFSCSSFYWNQKVVGTYVVPLLQATVYLISQNLFTQGFAPPADFQKENKDMNISCSSPFLSCRCFFQEEHFTAQCYTTTTST